MFCLYKHSSFSKSASTVFGTILRTVVLCHSNILMDFRFEFEIEGLPPPGRQAEIEGLPMAANAKLSCANLWSISLSLSPGFTGFFLLMIRSYSSLKLS